MSGLRSSWATPAASPPIAASRSDAQHFLPRGLQFLAGAPQAIDDDLNLLLNRRQLVAAANLDGAQIVRGSQQRIVQRDLNPGHGALQSSGRPPAEGDAQRRHERDCQRPRAQRTTWLIRVLRAFAMSNCALSLSRMRSAFSEILTAKLNSVSLLTPRDQGDHRQYELLPKFRYCRSFRPNVEATDLSSSVAARSTSRLESD